MLPNIADKDYVLIEPASPAGPPDETSLARGDIVVFRRPGTPHDMYVKRVVGMPGEEVRMAAGRLYLDGRLLEEWYATIPPVPGGRDSGEWWNGPDEYLMLGDNRRDSQDSRLFGPVDRSLIVGRVWFRYWPPGAWGRIHSENCLT